MMKLNIGIAVLIATILASAAAYSGDGDRHGRESRQPGGPSMFGGPMGDPEEMVSRMSRWLELDDTQKQELENIVQAAQPQLKTLRERERANREIIASMDASDPDYSVRIQDVASDVGQIATETTLLLAQLRLDIHNSLTPEQRQKLQDGADRMRERFNEKRNKDHADRHAPREAQEGT